MCDTAERVKRFPSRWEQMYLSMARADGQEAVDRMAERIARHNDRIRRLYDEMRNADDWLEKKYIANVIEHSGLTLDEAQS